VTYTLIDTPTFIALQSWFLNTVCLENSFSFYNIHELDWLSTSNQMLISTWALSESPKAAIEMAAQSIAIKYTQHVMLAYQQTNEHFEAAGDIVTLLNEHRVEKIGGITPVPYLIGSGNMYATC
jgi:hypothetical protein